MNTRMRCFAGFLLCAALVSGGALAEITPVDEPESEALLEELIIPDGTGGGDAGDSLAETLTPGGTGRGGASLVEAITPAGAGGQDGGSSLVEAITPPDAGGTGEGSGSGEGSGTGEGGSSAVVPVTPPDAGGTGEGDGSGEGGGPGASDPADPPKTDESPAPAETEEPSTAPKLLSFQVRNIKGIEKKGSISGSVSVGSGQTVVVSLEAPDSSVQLKLLTETDNAFSFTDLAPGEYTLTIFDAANPSLKLTFKQTVASEVTPDPITNLKAKAGPNKLTVTGKGEANHVVVVGSDPASQQVNAVCGADGSFTAELTCPAGKYTVWAQYANMPETNVKTAEKVEVEDEPIEVYPLFRRGDRNHPLIFRLQQRLRALGYYTIAVDGIFGSGTERAVRLFQQVNGIHPANGVATSATQQVLYSSSAKSFHEIIPYYPVSGTLYRSPYYQPAVVPLQQRLRALGYYTGSADGYFGSRTQAAVRNFQARNGLPVTGNADPLTQKTAYSSSAVPAGGGGGHTPSTGYRLLYWGCRGAAVVRLQQALLSRGYTQVRSADGIYGRWTYDAVRAFQRDHGLTVDGIAGRKTQNALYGTHY